MSSHPLPWREQAPKRRPKLLRVGEKPASAPRKPAILLAPNVAGWVIGAMAIEIIKAGSGRFDFYLMPENLLAKRPDLSRWLLARMDLVHALNETGVELVRALAPAAPPRLLTWIHHVTRWTPGHEAAAKHSELLTVCTRDWAESINEFCENPPPICVIPHGVDTTVFRRTRPRRRSFGIPKDAFAIGFIASKQSNQDNNRKGVDTMLEVMKRLKKNCPANQAKEDIHVSFVGTWKEEVDALRAAGISANYLPFLAKDDLPAFYSSIDAYLMTARVEGGPCTVLESMACETPVVATRVGLVPGVVADGVNSYSSECDDVNALTEALASLRESEPHRRQLGAKARKTLIARGLTWGQTLQPLLHEYGKLTAGRMTREPEPAPAWFGRQEAFTRAAVAADALLWLWRSVRMGRLSLLAALLRCRPMLSGLTFPDIFRGVGMLTGMAFRAPRPH